jgi:hypothetical protein
MRNLFRKIIFISASITMLVFGLSVGATFAQTHMEFKIRTITASTNISMDNYAQAIAGAKAFIDKAITITQADGWQKHGGRISMTPWAYWLKGLSVQETRDFVKKLRDSATGYGFNVGPGIVDDTYDPQQVAKLVALYDTGANTSVIIASKERGIHYNAIRAAAEIIKKRSEFPGTRANNSGFAALANCQSEIPFFPGGYHNRSYNSFSIGTEGASLFMKIAAQVKNIRDAEKAMYDAYTKEMIALEATALKIEKETGWIYEGIDTTPAPMGDISMGKAIEDMIGAPFGTPGTLAACAMLTNVIKKIPVRKIGYVGLFLPPMEDNVLAKRAYDYYGLNDLLAFSAVSGTGIDVLALPGDVTVAELEKILLDVAAMSIKLDKPLTARLMPFKGRKAGDLVDTKEETGTYAPIKVMKVR